jgi:transcriptional regulator with XRE-family HTH domain
VTKQGGWEETGFGPQLRTLRERAGFTQQQLGERAGCHSNTIAKLERGDQEPAWPLVLAICKALNVDCTAFSQAPTTTAAPRPRGRPPKALGPEGAAKSKRKPKKGAASASTS